MIIGVMGKGGSGKSTVSTQLVESAYRLGSSVLGIDADHNMDLLFNLAPTAQNVPFLGQNRAVFDAGIDLQSRETYARRLQRGDLPTFSFSPPDVLTSQLTFLVRERMRLMVAGPHTEEVKAGSVCSHVLAAPLKAYLPCLDTHQNDVVVVDSTAGMDMVGSGIAVGMDLVYIVAEPTIHSTKTAKQIAEGLKWFHVPHVFVVNKVQRPEQVDQAAQWLGEAPMFVLSFAADAQENETIFGEMIRYAEAFARSSGGAAVRRARAAQGIEDGVDQMAKNG